MTVKAMRMIIENYADGQFDAEQAMEYIMEMYPARVDRCTYIRNHYVTDPTLRFVHSLKTGKRVNTMVHAGGGRSPVPVDRAIWFILKGDDPAIVGRERNGRLYAVHQEGGDRVYA